MPFHLSHSHSISPSPPLPPPPGGRRPLSAHPMKSSARTETERFSHHAPFKSKRKALLPMADSTRSNQAATHASSSSPSHDRSDITQMNHDQIISILQLLPIESVLSFSMTCRKFRSLASSDSLWEAICRREWGKVPVDALVASMERRALPWKRLYQQVVQMSSLSCARLRSKDGIFPMPRASHTLNFVSDYLVLHGGGCDGGRHLDDTWVAYVGKGGRKVIDWKQVNSGTPNGRFGHTCIAVGDALVLFGGTNDNGLRQGDAWIGQLSCEASSGINMSWNLLDVGPVKPVPRGAHAGCCIGDRKMLIHGGIGQGGLRLNDTWILDLSNGYKSARWHQVVISQPSPAARSGHSLTWIGRSRMILFGGRGTGFEALNDVWLLDMGGESPEWVQIAYGCPGVPRGVPLPRVGHSATLMFGGKVLIYGGEDSQMRRKDDFWLLDLNVLLALRMRFQSVIPKQLTGKMWKRLTAEGNMPGCRSFHTACADRSGRCLYIFGGMVDGVIHPAVASGLRFDGGLYLVELVLQL